MSEDDRDAAAQDAALPYDILKEEHERQERLRHVQEFLSSPSFLDLRDMAVEVADDPEAIEERKRDLDYRITVLRSVQTLLEEERRLLDRVQSVAGTTAAENTLDNASTTGTTDTA